MAISRFLKEKFLSEKPCWIINCISDSTSIKNIFALCYG